MNPLFQTMTRQNGPLEVGGSDRPVLLYFWANWCPPCQTVLHRLDGLADELAQSVIIGLVDVDQEPEIVTDLGITGIPTIVLLKQGIACATIQGIQTKSALKRQIFHALK